MRHASESLFVLALGLWLAGCAAPVAQGSLAEPEAPAEEPAAMAMQAAMPVLDGEGVIYVASTGATRPRVRYLDGQVSLNSHCAIRVENKLNRRIPPVYVNGRPIGFC